MSVPIGGLIIFALCSLAVTDNSVAHKGNGPRDMICNNGTDFKCVCLRDSTTVYENLPDCDQLMKSRELRVVDMRLRHVNLESNLYTKEKYETYFKRRIANIVSTYCEHQANECPGTTLRISKENVILLRVERKAGNVTRILFAITKNEAVASLDEFAVLDSVKVKDILGSQAGPLARILGGIRIDSVRVDRIPRAVEHVENDNKHLLLIIYAVATFFLICYVIGAIKIYRDYKRRKAQKKAKDEEDAIKFAVPNYGTCAEANGDKKRQQKVCLNGGHIDGDCEKEYQGGYQTINENVDDNGIRRIDSRHARLMFACDPSQLPMEMSFDDGFQMNTRESSPRRHKSTTPINATVSRESSAPRDTSSVIVHHNPTDLAEPAGHTELSVRESTPLCQAVNSIAEMTPSQESDPMELQKLTPPPSFAESSSSQSFAQSPEHPPLPILSAEKHDDNAPPLTVPSLILHPSNSMCDSALDSSGPQSTESNEHDDEILDMRERHISPDSHIPVVDPADLINRSRTAQELDQWSSSDGEVDVYYKMSEDEAEGDDWDSLLKAKRNKHTVDSESEEEIEERVRGDIEDGYVYERLQEDASPMPPHVIPTQIDSDGHNEDDLR